MTSRPSPFHSPPPPEVPLAQPPLVRVIAQLRFAPIAALGQLNFIAPFQEAIRRRYPILRPEQATELLLGPDGAVVQQAGGHVWRFHDKRDVWRVSLAPEFVAIESLRYESRTDFFARWQEVLAAFVQVTDPGPVGYDRFGLRYINRVIKPQLHELQRFVWPEVLGLAGTEFDQNLKFSICESSFSVDEAELRTRWGLLPSNATTDPTTIERIPDPSWILDLDMFVDQQTDFDVSAIVAQGENFAESIYKFFRWCVTEDFLKAYGGQP